MLYDALVIGCGPAGLSAAQCAVNVGRSVALFDSSSYRNAATLNVHTIGGHEGKTPAELRASIEAEIKQAEKSIGSTLYTRFDEELKTIEISGEGIARRFKFTGNGQTAEAKTVIVCTGLKEVLPSLPGFKECWGRTVVHCAACFTVEVAGKKGAILGPAEQISKGHLLFSKLVDGPLTILLDGKPVLPPLQPAVDTLRARGHTIVESAVTKLEPVDAGVRVHFADGTEPMTFGFTAHQPAKELSSGTQAIVKTLGLSTTDFNGGVLVDTIEEFKGMGSMGSTKVSGVYAAGDIAQPITLASQALASGPKTAGFAMMMLATSEHGLEFPKPPAPAP